MFKFVFSLAIVAVTYCAQAQTSRYVIKLKNKAGTSGALANPSNYLSQRAIERRVKYAILTDSTDLPVSSSYLSQIAAVPNVFIINVSKWLNAVCIQTTDPNALATINDFSFVQSATAVAARSAINNIENKKTEQDYSAGPNYKAQKNTIASTDYYNYGSGSLSEINIHNGRFLHNIGMRGQNIQIALLDGGFYNYTLLKAFDSANANGQILSTWDFVSRHVSVVEDDAHGMQCLSTIVANIPGQFIGKAPKASIHLFRTEDAATEYPIEEFNWACAAERADSVGADIISASLGYGYGFGSNLPDYPKTSLDGNTNMSSIAADLAAKKGILVFVSAGNEGNKAWHTILSPADADSVVTIGAVNIDSVVAAFSSYGPSADGQVKPDVASMGVAAMLQMSNNNIGFGNGTSFACPNMAGIAACLWQAFPELNNMRIVRALKEAGNKANAPDNRTGYGIPNIKKAFETLLKEYATTSFAAISTCHVILSWNSKDVTAMKYEIEKQLPSALSFSKIGEVAAKSADVLKKHDYNFSDKTVSATTGTILYRIKQIIDTANASFSAIYLDTIAVNISSPCFSDSSNNLPTPPVTLQPNPTNGNTNLVVDIAEPIPNMSVTVFDSKGQLLMQLQLSKGTGKFKQDISTQKLKAGLYYIRVFNAGKFIGMAEFIKL